MSEIDLRYSVLSVESGAAKGAAFLVSDEDFGYVVTCYHIVNGCTQVELGFEPTGSKILAELDHEHSSEGFDIASLRLLESPPSELYLLDLAVVEDYSEKEFRSYGFPPKIEAVRAKGIIDGFVPPPVPIWETLDDGLLQLRSHDVVEGMSGAPVVLAGSQDVAGIIVGEYETKSPALAYLAYAQPVRAILQIWPELSQSPLIHNRLEWLAAVGLSHDPFEFPDGGQDPYLSTYFYETDYFWEVLKSPKTVFVFGDRGSGKSAFRKVVTDFCLNGHAGAKILPVPNLSFAPLVRLQEKRSIGPEDHVEEILKCGIAALAKVIGDGDKTVLDHQADKLDRDYLWMYVKKYKEHLRPAMVHKLETALNPSSDVEYPLPTDCSELLRHFCETVTSLGFDRVYFLVDPTLYGETYKSVFLPLISDGRVLDLSESNGAFRFFLDKDLMNMVIANPAVSMEMVKWSPLQWDDSELVEMLELRLKAMTQEGRDYRKILGKMFAESDSFKMLLEGSGGNPRKLVTLFHILIREHCRSSLSGEHLAITIEEVNRILGLSLWDQPD